MGVFGDKLKLNEASNPTGGGVFFLPKKISPAKPSEQVHAEYSSGLYRVKVETTKTQRSRKAKTSNPDLFILETLIVESNVPERPAGSRCTWMINFETVDAAPSNIRGIMIALAGSALGRALTASEVSAEDWDVLGEDAVSNNRFAGTLLDIETFWKAKRNQKRTPGCFDLELDPSYFPLSIFKPVFTQESKENAA